MEKPTDGQLRSLIGLYPEPEFTPERSAFEELLSARTRLADQSRRIGELEAHNAQLESELKRINNQLNMRQGR